MILREGLLRESFGPVTRLKSCSRMTFIEQTPYNAVSLHHISILAGALSNCLTGDVSAALSMLLSRNVWMSPKISSISSSDLPALIATY